MDAKFDERGRQIPDDTPVEVPMKLRVPKTEYEKIAEQVTLELSRQNEEKGNESFEESMDFDIEDDLEDVLDLSPYEVTEMQEEFLETDREAYARHQMEQEAPAKEELERQDKSEKAAEKEIE